MFKVVEGKSSREDLMAVLTQAVESGAIQSVADVSLREIIVIDLSGNFYCFEWYTNLVTVKCGSFDFWCTAVDLSTNHPSYKISLALSVRGFEVAYLGRRI